VEARASDADLIRNITKGIPGTQMPAIPMSEADARLSSVNRSNAGQRSGDSLLEML
jgi:hypothetical protein